MTRLVCTFAVMLHYTHACLYTCMYNITYTVHVHVCNKNASSQWDKSAVVRVCVRVCVCVWSSAVQFRGDEPDIAHRVSYIGRALCWVVASD